MASRVGNRNFIPAITPYEGVNQNWCDPVLANYYNIDYLDFKF